MHRPRILFGVILSTMLLLAACSVFQPQSTALADPATIRFVVSNETRDYYTQKVTAFKGIEPNITVELVNNTSQDIDVREIGWLDVQTGSENALDKALDLSPFIEQEADFKRDDFYPGLLEAFQRDGKQLALPSGVDPFVLFYNQNLFDQYGVAYPAAGLTWDEFKTRAMQLRDPEAKIYGYLPQENYLDAIFFSFQHGAALLEGDQPQLDSLEAVQALEWYASLFTEMGAAPNAAQVEADFGGRGVYAAIFRGMGGMWMGQFSQLPMFSDERAQFKVGIAPLPVDVSSSTVALFQGLVISAQTKEPEAAWRWVRFLYGQPQPWSVPVRRSVAQSEEYAAMVGKDQAAVARSAVENARLVSSFDMQLFQPVMETYLSAVAQTVDGMLPAADTLREAQQSVSP